jgi:hypothetical protein
MSQIKTPNRMAALFQFLSRRKKYRLQIFNMQGEECPMLMPRVNQVFRGVAEQARRHKDAKHILIDGSVYKVKWQKS